MNLGLIFDRKIETKMSKVFYTNAISKSMSKFHDFDKIILTISPILATSCLFQNISSRPEVYGKKGVLKDFTKFKGNTCTRVFIKKACNFSKKETLAQLFFCEFCETFKNTFFIEHLC